MLQFINTFFNQINSNFYENRTTKAIPNEVVCVSKVFSIRDWMNWMKDENYRRELFKMFSFFTGKQSEKNNTYLTVNSQAVTKFGIHSAKDFFGVNVR